MVLGGFRLFHVLVTTFISLAKILNKTHNHSSAIKVSLIWYFCTLYYNQ